MNFIETLADRVRKRARYNRTLAELRSLPIDTALDLDIYHGDAEMIARRAVYGI